MTQEERPQRKEQREPAAPDGLIGNPLDFIAADHAAERQVCSLIERIAGSDQPLPDDAKRVVSFLYGAFRLHLLDEEEDLFPLLRQRCEPEDEIDKIIGTLQSDHRHPLSDYSRITGILESTIIAGSAIGADNQRILADYALRAHRHLSVENAIILPIARARLTSVDLRYLRQRMLQRRNLPGDDDAG